jgi:hypothetical protein
MGTRRYQEKVSNMVRLDGRMASTTHEPKSTQIMGNHSSNPLVTLTGHERCLQTIIQPITCESLEWVSRNEIWLIGMVSVNEPRCQII